MSGYITLGTLGAGVFGLLLLELPPIASWVALRLTRKALDQLPDRVQAIKREEWSAELEAMSGSRLAKVVLAIGFLRASTTIRNHEPRRGAEFMATHQGVTQLGSVQVVRRGG